VLLHSTCLLIGLSPDIWDNGSQPPLNRSAQKFAHKGGVGPRLKTYFRKFFSPTPKIWGEETSNFRGPPSIGTA